MNKIIKHDLPRLPLDGILDLTYRCNNNCRHCWLWLPSNSQKRGEELPLSEIQRIVTEARQMGCQTWAISGGEPMLRSDFAEIFDYITRKSVSYSLNTNGTLISPEIAKLMTRKGKKMVALYGATAKVHDGITRNAGSFDATMQGLAYLKEAGAGFIVQLVPMRGNYHQYKEMLALAETLSPHYRIGSPWLFLSASGSTARNREIRYQRLDPKEVLILEQPDPGRRAIVNQEKSMLEENSLTCQLAQEDNRLFAACISTRREFHIDPYGGMSFCYYVKDPNLRFDLRKSSFAQIWEDFLPEVAATLHGSSEYLQNCGVCNLRGDCRWCAVFGYLEHRRLSAKVDYLCQIAAHTHQYNENWESDHIKYYEIAGITIKVIASFPIKDGTFAPKFRAFEVNSPGKDTISIRLESSIPKLSDLRLGKGVYHREPWAIYKQHHSWVYLGIMPNDPNPHSVAIFNEDHSIGRIYHAKEVYEYGGLESITAFTTDQILLARVLAERQACYIHAAGINIDGRGYLFVGHSEAGKSTIMKMLRGDGEILCDDRIIIRRWPEGFQIHGTWSNGELSDVSSIGVPLKAILFIEKSTSTKIIPIANKLEGMSNLLAHTIRAVVDASWWDKTLTLADMVADEIPLYKLRFDLSGSVRDVIKKLN